MNKKIFALAENFYKLSQDRKKGKSLKESFGPEYEFNYAVIYRACDAQEHYFHSMDYVTLKKDFAIGHAEHNAVVNEEPQHVLKLLAKTSDLYEAYNPGEYFYDGPEIKGKVIYKTKEE